MPPDPTKLCQPCRVCRKPWDGEAPKTTYTNETWAHDGCLHTPTPLTEAELVRLTELHDNATPAPWNASQNTAFWDIDGPRDVGHIADTCASSASAPEYGRSMELGESNAKLIAALRNAAPALLAAFRENAGLREEVKWLKEKRSVGFDNIDDLITERDAALARAAELESVLAFLRSHSYRSDGTKEYGVTVPDLAVESIQHPAKREVIQAFFTPANTTPKETPQ